MEKALPGPNYVSGRWALAVVSFGRYELLGIRLVRLDEQNSTFCVVLGCLLLHGSWISGLRVAPRSGI